MNRLLFKNVRKKMYLEMIYLIYKCKKDLTLNNLLWFSLILWHINQFYFKQINLA